MNFYTTLVLFMTVLFTFIIYRAESNSIQGVFPVNTEYCSSLYIRSFVHYTDPFSTIAARLEIP